MELLVALIPALPLAGFLFAVFVGPRLDRIPLHGAHDTHAAEGHGAPPPDATAHDAHAEPDTADMRPIPTEEQQAETSPHTGHDDDLANAEGAAGVIPPDLKDGLGQPRHVTPG